MPMEMNEFKLPDEDNQEDQGKPVDNEFDIEIEDDTPEEDRGRQPLPASLKEELEKDELDEYDDKIKTKFKQMRKVYHDERREKERIARENAEAVSMLQRLMDENNRYRQLIQTGSKEYATSLETTANLEVDAAKRKYKEAYDAGDADALAEAAHALSEAQFKAQQAKNFRPPLQEENYAVQHPQSQAQPADPKLTAWRERNPWYGKDDEMTAAAIGLHRKLEREGNIVIGSDRYYAELDKTIRKRFPEHFENAEESDDYDVDDKGVVKKAKTESAPTKPSTVVAPAVRSTASKKVRLKQSTLDMIRKLNITPEQYVREQLKLESKNG